MNDHDQGFKINKNVILAILLLIIIILIGYIIIEKSYDGLREHYEKQIFEMNSTFEDILGEEKDNAFREGANYGYQEAVYQIMESAVKCETVPITAENMTLNMIPVECLEIMQPEMDSKE